MKSENSASFRAPGQRSIPSTRLFRASHPCSSNSSVESSDKSKRQSSLSLNAFLNRKLHTSSVLPINKDEKASSVVKKESFSLAADCNAPNASNIRNVRHDCEGRVDEKGCVIEASVFKLFNDSGEKVRKRSSECATDENGTGWWDPERVGVDSEEVRSLDMWEGMGTTTLGALDWH